VLGGISHRLSLVEMLLSQTNSGAVSSPALTIQLNRSAAKGVDELWKYLEKSRYDAGFHDVLATVIALTRQLVEISSNLAESAPILSVEDQERCQALAANLGLIRSGLMLKRAPEWIHLPFTRHATNPVVIELERTAALIAQSFSDEDLRIPHSLSASAPNGSIMAFIADTLRSPEHVTFAVRGTLSAFLCYLFYMGTGWMSLGSSILTCTLTARRLTGASRHRQSLRFGGFIVGTGVIGWGAEVLILPQIDSLAQYAFLFLSVFWIGSWVATSGQRIAFSGFQIVLAYCLVNLNKFTNNTSLVPARDTILSIVLGVVAMWIVFDHLWAQSSSATARSVLLTTLHSVANFQAVQIGSYRDANERLTTESVKLSREFDKMRDLADIYPFESFPKSSHESLVNRSIRTLLPELRVFLLVKTGLLQHRTLAVSKAEDVLIREVEERTSNMLHGLANAIEEESPEQLSSWNVRTEELRTKISIEEAQSRGERDRPRHTEMRLCASLLDVASDLERRARMNFSNGTNATEESGNWSAARIA